MRRITRLSFGYELLFCKIWEHRVINKTSENLATDWEKKDRSVVFNTLFVFFVVFFVNWYGICFLPFWWESVLRQTRFEDDFKRYAIGLNSNHKLHNLSMWILIISPLWAWFQSILPIMFLVCSIEKLTSKCDLFVIKKMTVMYSHCQLMNTVLLWKN